MSGVVGCRTDRRRIESKSRFVKEKKYKKPPSLCFVKVVFDIQIKINFFLNLSIILWFKKAYTLIH